MTHRCETAQEVLQKAGLVWVRDAPLDESIRGEPTSIDSCCFCGRKASALYYDIDRPAPHRACARCIQAARVLLAPTLALQDSGIQHELENDAGEFELMPYAEIAKRLGPRRS